MKSKVVIIGGGASGLVAAIVAARQGADVVVLEHMPRVGKKILATGNGKCNLTNLFMPEFAYRSNQPNFPKMVLKQFSVKETLDFFEGIGLCVTDRNGYVYPASSQAASVVEVLHMEALHEKVAIFCEEKVESIRIHKQGFLIHTALKTFQADKVILATGSKAAPNTGSDGSGYELARSFGHKVIKPLPALVQIRCKESYYKALSGIRAEATVRIFVNKQEVVKEHGELQLTDYGISGIPVFQVSRYVSRALEEGEEVYAVIDFYPSMEKEDLLAYLCERRKDQTYKTIEEYLCGMMNKKLIPVLLKEVGIKKDSKTNQLTKQQWNQLIVQLKKWKTQISGVNPFANAQVCCGGVDTREIDEITLESKRVKGLYFAGELMDVDGICGGYNLQWAWTTGTLAGKYAGEIK